MNSDSDEPKTADGARMVAGDVDETHPRGLRLRCPHCHGRVEVGSDDSLDTIACPSCGSVFSLLVDDATCAHHVAGRKLAHFELIEQVGVGQFGVVWKARDTLLDRIVAIKIPRRDMLSSTETEFFFRDARAAAQLRHPNIVSVHEVGRDGETVYIATDFIDGANLQEWLNVHSLPPREAAELVITVAKAVHHAHEKGIVHRDLKPGNILLDSKGAPHVADFGLAKRDSGEVTMTIEGHILGTPAYMSPEQASGHSHTADARSDVYSLGVILFELLTGERPFRGEKRMLVVQIVHDEPPSPRKFNSHISRDLETITLKCLEKDPGRRYSTALALAGDLGRHLAGEPVVARPLGRTARTWRWCKRNSRVAALGATVAMLLLITTIVSTGAALWIAAARDEEASARLDAEYQGQLASLAKEKALAEAHRAGVAETRAHDEADRADSQAKVAAQVSDFLVGMFQGADPVGLTGYSLGGATAIDMNTTALDILKYGASRTRQDTEQLEVELATVGEGPISEPLSTRLATQAKLLDAIGNVYSSYMRFDDAEPLLMKSLALRRRLFGDDHQDVAQSLHSLSILRFAEGDFEAAEEAARKAVAIRRNLLGSHNLQTALSEFMLAWIINYGFEPRLAEAQKLMEDVLAVRRDLEGDNHRNVALARLGLATVLFKADDNVRAANEVRLAAEVMSHSGIDPRLLEAVGFVVDGLIARTLGNHGGSIEFNRKAVAKVSEVFGPQHPAVTYLKREVALALNRGGRPDLAEELFKETLELDRRNLGSRPLVGHSLVEYGEFLQEHYRFDEAAETFGAAYKVLNARLKPESVYLAALRRQIGQNALLRGHNDEALKECDESVRVFALLRGKIRVEQLQQSLYLLGRAGLAAGDADAYHRSCQLLTSTVEDRVGVPFEQVKGAAFQCIWSPSAVHDLSEPVTLAKSVIGKSLQYPPTARTVYGAALYRAGRYEEALSELRASTAEQTPQFDFVAQVFLAMVQSRLNGAVEANRSLSEAEKWMADRLAQKAREAADSQNPSGDANRSQHLPVRRVPPMIEWDETVLFKRMLDEAKGVVGPGK